MSTFNCSISCRACSNSPRIAAKSVSSLIQLRGGSGTSQIKHLFLTIGLVFGLFLGSLGFPYSVLQAFDLVLIFFGLAGYEGQALLQFLLVPFEYLGGSLEFLFLFHGTSSLFFLFEDAQKSLQNLKGQHAQKKSNREVRKRDENLTKRL